MENIGTITKNVKKMLSLTSDVSKIFIDNENFKKHLIKRNHQNMISHIPKISQYLKNPDYVGVNQREKGVSLEYIVQVEPNILIAVKLDSKNGYFYVATMHEISQLKLTQRIRNGRLQKVDKR